MNTASRFSLLLILIVSTWLLANSNRAHGHTLSFVDSTGYTAHTEWTEVWRSSPTDAEYLFTNPKRMVLHNDWLFVTDFEGERPVWVFDTNDGSVQTYLGALGQGPGEVEAVGAIDIVEDKYLAVQDIERQAISLFDIETGSFNYQLDKQFTFTVGFDSNVMVQTPFSMADRDIFARAYDITTTEEGRTALGNVQWEIALDDVGETFAPLHANPLQKQGPIIVEEGIAYIAFLNAGHLVGLSAETGEVLFVTQEPHNVDPPDFIGAQDEIDMMAPPVNQYPTMAIGLTTDAHHVYALHSGVVVETADDLKRIEEAEQVDVYDKTTGAYKHSVDLPYPARDLVVTDSHVYLLTMDEEPVLFKYEKPEVLSP